MNRFALLTASDSGSLAPARTVRSIGLNCRFEQAGSPIIVETMERRD
jgi:hypothetical protein